MAKATCTHPDGCTRRSKNKTGPCGMHLERLRTSGEWGPVEPLRPYPVKVPAERRIGHHGYVFVWCPDHPMAMADGYALEHRKVMYDAGFDPTGYHVHHRNEDTSDNRLENLGLKTESQHHRDHAQEAGYVVNQFGTWPLHSRR